jgi:glucose-6-phosphate isomerase
LAQDARITDPELEARVNSRLAAMERDDVVGRIWAGDHTVWSADPAEITAPNRLGWLTVAEEMRGETEGLRRFAAAVAADGYDRAVLLGMGGSSLAAEVLASTFGARPGGLKLSVLDTTDPAEIEALVRDIELDRTLFIVASKSGTTVETLSHLTYFWEKLPDGRHFVAITDAGSYLDRLGRERGFRTVFLNPESIGGRYSALSLFGLVPAALIGAGIDGLIESGTRMAAECRRPAAENAGAWLGAVLGEAALAGRDKLTLLLPDAVASLGAWIEQLIAESTGKAGRGIVPVVDEPPGAPEAYGDDRLFVALGESATAGAIERGGLAVVRLPFESASDLGAEFYRWQFATAVAGHVLAINPFDQPNVQEAKDATARVLGESRTSAPDVPGLGDSLASVAPGDYVALLSYLPRSAATQARLQAVRRRLRDRFRVATTLGYGPRYLHSTGQLHKGGPDSGVFVQVYEEGDVDLPIPGQPYGFGDLKRAQALGDLLALQERGRRVTRVTLAALEAATD